MMPPLIPFMRERPARQPNRDWVAAGRSLEAVEQFMAARQVYYAKLREFSAAHGFGPDPIYVVLFDEVVGFEHPASRRLPNGSVERQATPEGFVRDTPGARPAAALRTGAPHAIEERVYPKRKSEAERELRELFAKYGKLATGSALAKTICGNAGPFYADGGRTMSAGYGIRKMSIELDGVTVERWILTGLGTMPQPYDCVELPAGAQAPAQPASDNP